jgi:hypothetical protein
MILRHTRKKDYTRPSEHGGRDQFSGMLWPSMNDFGPCNRPNHITNVEDAIDALAFLNGGMAGRLTFPAN